jgi:hypothetical protein
VTGDGVLAWDASRLWTGALDGSEVDLTPVAGPALTDIRGCSVPAAGGWAVVGAVDPATGRSGLWRVELGSGAAERLLEAYYLLTPGVDPGGSLVAYPAAPAGQDGDLDLHLLDLASGVSRLLAPAVAARSAVPSWRPDRTVLIHGGGTVVAVDSASGRVTRLFPGEYPAVSPAGDATAYRAGARILVAGADEISPLRGRPRRSYLGGMSWSPDGRRLIVGWTGGLLGYEKNFGVLDARSRRLTRIRRRYLAGLIFT